MASAMPSLAKRLAIADERPVGDVARFAVACIEDGTGEVELGVLHTDYCAWCEAEGVRALSRTSFIDRFTELSAFVGFELTMRGRNRILQNARVRAVSAAA